MALAPSLPLFGVPSAAIRARSSPTWSAGVAADGHLGQRAVDVGHGLGHAFAAVALLVAVAQLDRLVDSRAGPRGNRGPAERAVGQDHIDLDGRVAAAVENLAPAHLGDRRNWFTHGCRQAPSPGEDIPSPGRAEPPSAGSVFRCWARFARPLRLAIAILPSSCTPSGTFTWIALVSRDPGAAAQP